MAEPLRPRTDEPNLLPYDAEHAALLQVEIVARATYETLGVAFAELDEVRRIASGPCASPVDSERIESENYTARARLDAVGPAEPLTEIVAVMPTKGDRWGAVHVGQATHYVARPTAEQRLGEAQDPTPFLDRLKGQPSRDSRIDASAFLSEFATPTQFELAHLLDMVKERLRSGAVSPCEDCRAIVRNGTLMHETSCRWVTSGYLRTAEATPVEKPVCDVCGEEDSDERVYGKVEVCRLCLSSADRIEQLTDLLQRFIDGGRLESLLQACDNAGLRPRRRESAPSCEPKSCGWWSGAGHDASCTAARNARPAPGDASKESKR